MKQLTEMTPVLSYYAQAGRMTGAGPYAPLFSELPDDIPSLVRILQGLAVHIFWAGRYGLELPEDRKAEVQIRPVQAKMDRLLELDGSPLTEARPLERRLVCNCRDFSLILASMLKAHGIPARARCGFGTYFTPGHYEDHWMTEVWRADLGRWAQVDAQLDDLQKEVLGITFDSLDMPPGQFVLAGEAWQMCRNGKANPDDFGIFDMHGWDFIFGNVMRDLASLNQVELLPWDVWGLMETSVEDASPEQLALIDEAARLTLAGDGAFDEMRAFYEQNPCFKAPESL